MRARDRGHAAMEDEARAGLVDRGRSRRSSPRCRASATGDGDGARRPPASSGQRGRRRHPRVRARRDSLYRREHRPRGCFPVGRMVREEEGAVIAQRAAPGLARRAAVCQPSMICSSFGSSDSAWRLPRPDRLSRVRRGRKRPVPPARLCRRLERDDRVRRHGAPARDRGCGVHERVILGLRQVISSMVRGPLQPISWLAAGELSATRP